MLQLLEQVILFLFFALMNFLPQISQILISKGECSRLYLS